MDSREIVDIITDKYGELATEPAAHPALITFANAAEKHGVLKLFHSQDIQGPVGDISLDVIALCREHIIELEYYHGKKSSIVSVTELRAMVYAALREEPIETGRRLEVRCHWEDGSQSFWRGAADDQEWLTEFGFSLLSLPHYR